MTGLNIKEYREKHPDVSKMFPDDNVLATAVYRSNLEQNKLVPENYPYEEFRANFFNVSQDDFKGKSLMEIRFDPTLRSKALGLEDSDIFKTVSGTAEKWVDAVKKVGQFGSDITEYPAKKLMGFFDPEWEKRYEEEREAYRESADLLRADMFGYDNPELLNIKGIPRATLNLAKKQIESGQYKGTLKDFLNDPNGLALTTYRPNKLINRKPLYESYRVRLDKLPDNYKNAILQEILPENETELSNFDVEISRPEKSTLAKGTRIVAGDLGTFVADFMFGSGRAKPLLRASQHLKYWDDLLTKKLDDLAVDAKDTLLQQIGKSSKRTAITGVQKLPQYTIAGEWASQTLLNPYEQTLSVMLSDMSRDDDAFGEDLIQFLAADKTDSELEARMKMALENLIIYPVAIGAEIGIKTTGISALGVLRGMKEGKDYVGGQAWKAIESKKLGGSESKVIAFMYDYGQQYSSGIKRLYDEAGKIIPDRINDVKRIMSTNDFYRGMFTKVLLPFFRQGAQSKRQVEATLEAQGTKRVWQNTMTNLLDTLRTNIDDITKSNSFKERVLKTPININKVKGTFAWKEGEITDRKQLLSLIQKILTSDYRAFGIVTSKGSSPPVTQSAGFNEILQELPKELRAPIREVRNVIDELSLRVLDSDLLNPELKRMISDNVGIYLTRSYRFFTDINWTPSDDVLDNFVTYLTTPQKNANGKMIPAAFESTGAARTAINDILTSRRTIQQEGLDEGFGQYVKLLNSLNKGVFKERKNVPDEMRAFLGEFEDPFHNLFHTTSKLAHYVTLEQYLKTLKELGEGTWLLSKEAVDDLHLTNPAKAKLFEPLTHNRTMHARNKNDSLFQDAHANVVEETIPMYGAIDGMYVPRDMKNVIRQVAGYQRRWYDRNDWVGKSFTALAGIKSLGNMNATVLNNITHERNFMSGPIFLVGNGAVPDGKALEIAYKSTLNDLRKTHKADAKLGINWDEYTNDLIRFRLAQSSVTGEAIQQVFNRFNTGFIPNLRQKIANNIENTQYGTSITRGLDKAASPIRQAKNVYVAEDTFWKSIYWEQQKKVLRRAYPDRSEEYIKREAARLVRDTMPNYNMLSPALQAFQYMPFGSFFAFRAEEIRTTFNMFYYGAKEVVDVNPVIREMGAKRLAGATAVAGPAGLATSTISEISKINNGIGDDVELAIHNLLPDYAKFGEYAYHTGPKGELYLTNIAYNDPYFDMHKEMVMLSMQKASGEIKGTEYNKKVTDLMVGALYRLFNPFVAESISSQAISQALLTGKDSYGQDIYDLSQDFDTDVPLFLQGDNLQRMFGHLGRTILKPKVITNMQRIADADEHMYDDVEFKFDYDSEVFANSFGIRYTKFDPITSFPRRIRELNRAEGAATRTFNSTVREQGVTIEEIVEARKRFLTTQKSIHSEKAMAVDSMFVLGFDAKEIGEMLKEENVSNKDQSALFNNRHRVKELSTIQIEEMLKNNPELREYSSQVTGSYLKTDIREQLDKVNAEFIKKNRLLKLPYWHPERREAYENNVLNLYPMPDAWEDFKRENQKKVKKGFVINE